MINGLPGSVPPSPARPCANNWLPLLNQGEMHVLD